MTRRVLFRVDSNSQIASGHVMRCLSIANQFRNIGCEVCFITADNLSDRMLSGYEHINLQSEWRNLDVELPRMKLFLIKCVEKPILIIDTYAITSEYVDALSAYATIVYLGSKRGYLGNLDFLINYSVKIEHDYYVSLYGDRVKLLLGLDYTPLREEFQNIQGHTKDNIERVLITTGNTDTFGYVPKILSALLDDNYARDFDYDIVIGSFFNDIDELVLLAKYHNNVHLYRNVSYMSDLMKDADLAITAAGTTVLELAAAKVPQIAFAMVEEQIRSAREFEESGMIDYAGEIFVDSVASIQRICNSVRKYSLSIEERQALINRASMRVDGKGCERIVAALMGYQYDDK